MKTHLKFILTITLAFFTGYAFSQDYNTGVGLRAGVFSGGLTIKGFVSERGAIEGIAGFGRRSFVTTGLYEYHIPIPDAEGLNLYVGGGAHLGLFWHRGTYLVYKYKDEKVYVVDEGKVIAVPGIDAIFGAEYKFKQVPIVVGMDLKPFIDFYDGLSAYPDIGLNVRFVF